jgi:hypothetical protein
MQRQHRQQTKSPTRKEKDKLEKRELLQKTESYNVLRNSWHIHPLNALVVKSYCLNSFKAIYRDKCTCSFRI